MVHRAYKKEWWVNIITWTDGYFTKQWGSQSVLNSEVKFIIIYFCVKSQFTMTLFYLLMYKQVLTALTVLTSLEVQELLTNISNRCFRQFKENLFTTYNKWKVPLQAVHENIMLQLHTVCRSCCLERFFHSLGLQHISCKSMCCCYHRHLLKLRWGFQIMTLTSCLAQDANTCLCEITGALTKHTFGVQQTLN